MENKEEGGKFFECPCCLRKVDFKILVKHESYTQIIKEGEGEHQNIDELNEIERKTFEFDPLGFHFRHCYYSPEQPAGKE